jgi:restriction system protein
MFLGWILVVILGIIILERIANPVSTTPILAIVIFGPIALVFLACGYPRRAGRIVRKVLPFVGAKARRAYAEEQRAMRQRYEQAVQQWQATVSEIAKRSADRRSEYRNALQAWERDRTAFLQLQDVNNAELKTLKQQYEAGPTVPASKAVVEFLMRRNLEELSDDYTVSFLSEGQLLLVDLDLPSKTLLPQYKMGKTKAVALSDKWKRETYEKALYETTLLLLSRVFRSDYKAQVLSIVFNGWVRSVDPTTGLDTHACIMSVQVGRDEFMCLDLRRVSPKACFRSLKGVSGSALIDLTPIRPILRLNKNDPRFIEAYGVVDAIDNRTNLASMDWQDFENLIREIFAKEFSSHGGEVKITRASRDGGVDAIAFDHDPIRGGKIIIQAKRYTNTVGVSAVRDLYGTVQHEGAMKGILVTTANFGNDAYEFAKDKPITLISGSELLGLLERHGHSAKINLAEARAEANGLVRNERARSL